MPTQDQSILSLDALRQLERQATDAGYNLMQRAAMATADWVSHHLPSASRLLICAGPGNNGGDALYAALELMRRRFRVDVLVPTQPTSPATSEALHELEQAQGHVMFDLPRDYRAPQLVIDGLFGVGLSRDFDLEWTTLIDRINQLGSPILALDCPSGLDAYTGVPANTAIQASHTLTFLCQKPGLFSASGADLAGNVELELLDCPPRLIPAADGSINQPDVRALLRPRNSHKGLFGTVCVIGGAPGMLGAALLAGRSALACGAGKVHVCPLDDRLPVDPVVPELMISALDEAAGLPDADVLAVGPGLGQQERAGRLLDQVIQLPQALVLDADALNLLANDHAAAALIAKRQAGTVLTPHPAEAARLLGQSTETVQKDRLMAARRLANHFNCVVVLKGAGSLIVGPDGFYHLNTSGGPALAVAGQGDVLTGIIAALLAQRMEPFEAASLAVHIHGLAGDDFEMETGGPIGLSASDTAWRASLMLNRLIQERAQEQAT
ncbi:MULTISPECIES: NAD(P)H-hydrate dehydratase [unclassified Chromobacterium]|nr:MULTISPECIES: NAD(P)H-hydrate dehydratase [unclassified Chromobacterium]MCP1289462.1 NAD(P)H-hydrate dehydratase [Chromobacterium sp. S0633]PTU64017.1 bifunctional ADP-dependent NAD(P)H-hydrate dehydratase/NAD(P)H-hydrate epimerase [Chromobacterium sp. Panama]UJB31938.1 NAD(P)H-hydrate dehydratase [Chromobacterium sp. Beijing]